MNRDHKKKILLVASHGGHWVQLQRFAKAFEGMNVYYVSTSYGLAHEIASARFSVVHDANLKSKFELLLLAWQVFWIVINFRPNIVVSTGAAPGYFAIVFGKIFGAKTIWVDSIANSEHLSVSGAKVARFADLWLTQWPHLSKPEGPYYKGSVL